MEAKATPIEQLPNVQMSMERDTYQDSNQEATQMADNMVAQQQAEQMNNQEQFRQRQFVPQLPPSHDPYSGQQMPPQPQQHVIYQEPVTPSAYFPQQPTVMPNTGEKGGQPPESNGYLDLLKKNGKLLVAIFALLFFAQLQGTQSIFRKLAGTVRVPEDYIYIGAKLLVALVLTVVFFLAKKNL
jgi:hypothetical protein